MNAEQAKSFARWFSTAIGPILISHGYASTAGLEMGAGVFVFIAGCMGE